MIQIQNLVLMYQTMFQVPPIKKRRALIVSNLKYYVKLCICASVYYECTVDIVIYALWVLELNHVKPLKRMK